MKILIDIGHPAHVHFFKYFISGMKKRGHDVMVTARNKDVTLDLLEAYKINFIPVGKIGNTKLDLITEWIKRDYEILKIAYKFNPDILMGMSNPCAAHSSKLLGKKSVIFNDSEGVKSTALITYPFADVICTPVNFSKDVGKKQIRFNGYKELAYLHPNHFTPDPAVLDKIGLSEKDRFVILRFVSWSAGHDIGQSGIQNKTVLVEELEKFGRVFITSEGQLDKGLEKYKIKVPPEKLHDLLYYASLYIGEGATMTTESAILGTPSIYISSLAGTMGNLIELNQKYGLVFNYSDPDKAISKAIELIQKQNLKEEWRVKKERLLKDKIDTNAFMIWLIENFPKSFEDIKENPDIQNMFKYNS